MSNFNTLEEIITNMPIFSSFSCTVFENSNKSLVITKSGKQLLYELFFKNKIRIYCPECKTLNTFEVKSEIHRENEYLRYASNFGLGKMFLDLNDKRIFDYLSEIPPFDEGVIEYSLFCSMSKTHYQKVYLLFELTNGIISIRKIGQKPLNTDLQNKLSNEYQNILKKYDSLEDFKCFERSESRNLLAGCCVYLRRILEKMVHKMLQDPSVNEEDLKRAKHFDEKISLVKHLFDPDIQDVLNNSYGLMSKGIHELSNDDIETFYKQLYEIIIIQLESEAEKAFKNKKRAELRKSINSASERYN